MEDNELPDAERLKELRQEGKFPYSRFAVRCITSAILLAVTYLQFSNFAKILSLVRKMFSEPVTNFAAVKQDAFEIVDILTLVFSMYGISFIVSFAVAVLIQSKFYFSLINIAFNLTQILKIHKASLRFFFLTIIRGIAGVFMGLAIGMGMFYWLSRQILSVFYGQEFIKEGAIAAELLLIPLRSLLAVSIFTLLIIAAIAYLGARYSFLRRHRAVRITH